MQPRVPREGPGPGEGGLPGTATHTHMCTLRVAKAVGLASLILQASGQLSQGVERKKPDF